eukprot:m.63504 g.63504  ORF g.63504 m.63504 type:complete len:53 (+) comp15839_c0_seq9:473-631(+)
MCVWYCACGNIEWGKCVVYVAEKTPYRGKFPTVPSPRPLHIGGTPPTNSDYH